MAKIYQNLGRTSALSVNSTGAVSLWTLDLSFIAANNLLLEMTTELFDSLNNTTAVYYSTYGVYKNTSALVASYSFFLIDSDYSYDGGDSRLLKPQYNQSTSELSQEVNVLIAGTRDLQFTYRVKVVSM